MDSDEVKSFPALAEESSKTVESLAPMFNEAVKDPAIIFSHSGCLAQPGIRCNCSLARMNMNEISALHAVAQSELVGQIAKPTIEIKLNNGQHMVLSGIASFFGPFTEARPGKPSLPKPLSASGC